MLLNIKVAALNLEIILWKKILYNAKNNKVFAKKLNYAIRAEVKPARRSKNVLHQKLRIVICKNFCLKNICVQRIFKALFTKKKNELCTQGRGHASGLILLIYNPSRDFYQIRSHTKFGWASSIILRVIVVTDRQTQTTCQKWLFCTQWPSKRGDSSKSWSRFFWPMQYFIEKVKRGMTITRTIKRA